MSVLAKFAKVVTEDDYERVFEGMGPLATFSAKINLCSVLGVLVGDMQHDLNIMRKIRNDFAHEVKDIDFTYREISSRCHSLKMTCDFMPGVLESAKTIQRKKFLASGASNLLHLSAMLQRNVIIQTVLQENSAEINRRARESAGAMIQAASKSAAPETQPSLPGISP
jgi:DNA-binding MltR family transcriptional regulator